MKGRIAILAVLLFIALLISPEVPQEGLFSPWGLWGAPLLTADFAILSYAAGGHVQTIDATR